MNKLQYMTCLFVLIIAWVSNTAVAQQTSSQQPPALQPSDSLESLLERVKQAQILETAEQRQREKDFIANRNKQKQLLADMLKQKQQLEARSAELEQIFADNELQIEARQEQLQERLGSLTELFGHVSATAADLRSEFETSVISAQYPGREQRLTALIESMSASTTLPSIQDMEHLWFESQREMTKAGTVETFSAMVITPDGQQTEQTVLRVGSFNLVQAGQYLGFNGQSQQLMVLPRQPEAGFTGNQYSKAALALQSANSGYHRFAIDPTGPNGGTYLAALITSPSIAERWKQGGSVGVVITLLAVVAIVLACWRLFHLRFVFSRVTQQLQQSKASPDNPLGRVLLVYEQNKQLDIENLEFKLAEAILKERPEIEKGISALKVIAMVAPLLGLLGTVIGMIMTFQAITIYGAGDPQAMAGGISSALVTTVLGLCVAVPTVMLHAVVNYRARQILTILEQQSYGVVADNMENSERLA